MADGSVMEFSSVMFRHKVPARKWYNPFKMRDGAGIASLDLSLQRGQIVGLVGTNGAGKTTLLRMMSGVLPIESGNVTSNGTVLSSQELRTQVGFMPEHVRWSGQETVEQTLIEFALLRGCSEDSAIEILGVIGLKNRASAALDSLSQGMRQRLSLGIALLGTPDVLVLDEPFNGMDPVAIDAFKRLLQSLAQKGIAIVISSHHLFELDQLIDTLALLHRGQLVAHGTTGSIQNKLGFEQLTELCIDSELPKKLMDSLEILEQTSTDVSHRMILQNAPGNLLKDILQLGIGVTTWREIQPSLIELLCAATGLDRQNIGMDVENSAWLPMRKLQEEEE